MIIRKREKPLVLQKYEILHQRLPANHPARGKINYELKDATRGYEGEIIVDRHLNILANSYTLLKDVTLRASGQRFQMDNLILTPNRIYIIEVKNFSKAIHFDTDLNQFSSGAPNQITGYNHPITQVKAQQLKLKNWLFEHNQQIIPIHYFVAIAEPNTLINVTGDAEAISNTVLHGEQIPWKIMEYEEQHNTNQPIPHQKIGHSILNNIEEFDMDVLKKHEIRGEELLPGVRCVQCEQLMMKRVHQTWVCSSCQNQDKTAGLHSLYDYFLLVKPWITNKELKQFLGINSRHTVKRILKEHPDLDYSPKTKRWFKRKM
jgi:hypothetical protein